MCVSLCTVPCWPSAREWRLGLSDTSGIRLRCAVHVVLRKHRVNAADQVRTTLLPYASSPIIVSCFGSTPPGRPAFTPHCLPASCSSQSLTPHRRPLVYHLVTSYVVIFPYNAPSHFHQLNSTINDSRLFNFSFDSRSSTSNQDQDQESLNLDPARHILT